MGKLVTGVSTDLDFVKHVNEHGASLTIGSTPDKLLESLETDESLNITYNTDNETIVSSVNRDVEPTYDYLLDLTTYDVTGPDEGITGRYEINNFVPEESDFYTEYLNQFNEQGYVEMNLGIKFKDGSIIAGKVIDLDDFSFSFQTNNINVYFGYNILDENEEGHTLVGVSRFEGDYYYTLDMNDCEPAEEEEQFYKYKLKLVEGTVYYDLYNDISNELFDISGRSILIENYNGKSFSGVVLPISDMGFMVYYNDHGYGHQYLDASFEQDPETGDLTFYCISYEENEVT